MHDLDPIIVSIPDKSITLPHLGCTTRTILAAASAEAWKSIDSLDERTRRMKMNWRPKFKLIYKKVIIGEIYLKSLGQFLRDRDQGLTPMDLAPRND
jgi:hypothetical protein